MKVFRREKSTVSSFLMGLCTTFLLSIAFTTVSQVSAANLESKNVPPSTGWQIIFTSNKDGNWDIFKMNDDGSEINAVTSTAEIDERWISCVPDKDRVLFNTNEGNVYSASINNSSAKYAVLEGNFGRYMTPTWSADQSQFAVVERNQEPNESAYKIVLVDPETNHTFNLPPQVGRQFDPTWMHKNRKLMYVLATGIPEESHEFWSVSANGTGLKLISKSSYFNCQPDISPDDKNIVFSSNRDGDFDIWTMSIDGDNLDQLTHGGGLDANPKWSPDGKWIVFVSNKDGFLRIYKMKSDGSELTQLTKGDYDCAYPNWHISSEASERIVQQQRTGNVLLTNIDLSSHILDIEKNEPVNISYTLNRPAKVNVAIWDSYDRNVRNLLDEQPQEKGNHEIEWDGKDKFGDYVPDEAYTFVIQAVDANSNMEQYDSAKNSGGEEYEPQEFKVPTYGKITYHLEKPCRVRVRIGVNQGALLREWLSWECRPAGFHVENWNGMDDSGKIELRNLGDLTYTIDAFTLPDNSIIVNKSKLLTMAELVALDRIYPDKRSFTNTNPNNKARHANHERRNCRPVRFDITFPPDLSYIDDYIPILTGKTPIRIIINSEDIDFIRNERFEISYYLDGTFLGEEEEGYDSLTIPFDIEKFPAGKHVLTVMVQGYSDHIGTQSMPIEIREEVR